MTFKSEFDPTGGQFGKSEVIASIALWNDGTRGYDPRQDARRLHPGANLRIDIQRFCKSIGTFASDIGQCENRPADVIGECRPRGCNTLAFGVNFDRFL